jgi:hypothetical protein
VQQLEAHELAAQELAARESAAQESVARELAAQQFEAHQLAAQELAAHELAQEPASQALTAQELTAQESAAQEFAAQEPAAHELLAHELAAQQLGTPKPAMQEPAAQESASQELAAQELAAQEPAPEPTKQTLDAFVAEMEEQVSLHLDPPGSIEYSVEAVESQPVEQPRETEPAPAEQPDESRHSDAIGIIVESFRRQPRTLLLAASPRDERYSAPPVTVFFALERPSPARTSDGSNRLPAAAPQPILLPGPCLPADLRNLRQNPARAALGGAKKLKLPAWAISVLAAMLLVFVGGSVFQNVNAGRDSKPAPLSTDPAAQSPASPEAVPSDAHPFGRYVEVTGVRVVADPQRRSQLQYLVVNHSNIQITGIALHINVRSADPSSKAPLIQVSAVIPSLGAYESKEIRTDLDTQMRSTEIPDWDHLKVDVQVTSR